MPELSPMMMGMLPPGVQQLFDALPPPEVMKRVAEDITHEDYAVFGTDAVADAKAVANFLTMLSQILVQEGLVQESKTQTEPLRLECPECHKTFGVDNAFQYRRRVQEGFIYACANDHEPTPVGSGRMGLLTPDEQLTFDNQPNMMVIYPPDYDDSENGNND